MRIYKKLIQQKEYIRAPRLSCASHQLGEAGGIYTEAEIFQEYNLQ